MLGIYSLKPFKITATNSGVTKIPTMLGADALHIAAARLPLAMEVKAIADCTVPGSMQRYRKPRYNVGVIKGSSTGRNKMPIRGKTTKVMQKMTIWIRQCIMPW